MKKTSPLLDGAAVPPQCLPAGRQVRPVKLKNRDIAKSR
jgi:hypothetical protein